MISGGTFSFKEWQTLRIEVYHLTGVLLVVSLCLCFQAIFQLLFYLAETLEPILETAISLVDACVDRVVLVSGPVEDLVDGRGTDRVLTDEITDTGTPFMQVGDLFSL